MNRCRLFTVLATAALTLPAAASAQTTMPWTQLSRGACGVDAFLKSHADHDGRGVVIAVIDTGVDMGVPGLDQLPGGGPKVIDAQDFCGDGDTELAPATWNAAGDRIVRYDNDGNPMAYVPPPAELRPAGCTLWVGALREKSFGNTEVPDVNDNGSRKDEFAVLLVARPDASDDDARVFVDADGDRDWSNDKPLRNYRVAQETFTFARAHKEQQRPQLTCCVNAFPRQRKVVFHYDAGGHGTHVAGIAAGWRINAQPGFDGIAPGASVISLKIGNSRFSGGATTTGAKKLAFEYAARFARERNLPVVCNLSYGIASEREGHSDIDEFLDRICRENPLLVVCTSAGNNGPGLSSIGTPAAAAGAITCAALMPPDTARDVLSAAIPAPVLATFSSRGGELAKPDIATPGFATSTVPTWNRDGDFFQGTSMASPYAAGLCALLICDARAEKPDAAVPSATVKLALRRSAEPLPGFTPLDYGAGMPDIAKAAAALKELRAAAPDPLARIDIRTESPLAVDGEGPAAFWRGAYFPADRPQVFTLKPLFAPTADAAVRRSFARRFTLRSTAAWCRVEQQQVALRAEQSATVSVRYDAAALRAPGLHCAAVELLDGDAVVERLWNTVVVPLRPAESAGHQIVVKDQRVTGWVPQRYFVAVPAGATGMHLALRADRGPRTTAAVRGIFRPNGNVIRTRGFALDSDAGKTEAAYDVTRELSPGVWEIDVTSRRADEVSGYELSIEFAGLACEPAAVRHWSRAAGGPAKGSLTVTNLFDRPLAAALSGAVEGYRRSEKVKLTPDHDAAKIAVKFDKATRAARVRIEMSEENYAMFTDVAVNAYDAEGASIFKAGMSDRRFEGEFNSPGGAAKCELEVRAAFTYPDSDQKCEFTVSIDHLYAKPTAVELTRGSADECVFYPGVPTPLEFKLVGAAPATPDGATAVGYLRAHDKASKSVALEVPIEVKAGH